MKVLTFHRRERECCTEKRGGGGEGERERIEQCTSCKEVVNDVYKWDSWCSYFVFHYYFFFNLIR